MSDFEPARHADGTFAPTYDQVARRVMMKALGDVSVWEADSWNIGVDAQLDALRVAGFSIVRTIADNSQHGGLEE